MDTWGEYGLSWTGPDVDDADVPPLLQQYGYNAMTEVGSCEDDDFGEAECCNSNQKNTEAACAQRCSSFCQKHYFHRTANEDQHLLTICVANKKHRKCEDGKMSAREGQGQTLMFCPPSPPPPPVPQCWQTAYDYPNEERTVLICNQINDRVCDKGKYPTVEEAMEA